MCGLPLLMVLRKTESSFQAKSFIVVIMQTFEEVGLKAEIDLEEELSWPCSQ